MARAITFDGPAGVGKSTTTDRLSQQLCVPKINTGLFYRGLSELMSRDRLVSSSISEVDLSAWLSEQRERLRLFGGGVLVLDNEEDITTKCRSAANSSGASRIASRPEARQAVNDLTTDSVREDPSDVVLSDGRDEFRLHDAAGTLGFGIYLTAPQEVSVLRRAVDDGSDPESIYTSIVERDMRDRTRGTSPLMPAYDRLRIVNGAADIGHRLAGLQLLLDTGPFQGREVDSDALVMRAIGEYRSELLAA